MLPRLISLLILPTVLGAPAGDFAEDLGGLLWEADRIALVQVTGVESVPVVGETGPAFARPHWNLDIAKLSIERRFIGPEEEARLVSLSTDSEREPDRCRLAAGDRALVFLRDISRSYGRTSKEERHALARWAAQEKVWVPCSSGIWLIDPLSEEVRIPRGLVLDRGAAGLDRPWSEEEWVGEIERVIGTSLPCLCAASVSTGPARWQIRLFADGRYEGTETGRIDASSAAEMFHTLEAWRDWPRELGVPSHSPCLGWTAFTLHERREPLRLWVSDSRELPQDEVEATRVQEAWALLEALRWKDQFPRGR